MRRLSLVLFSALMLLTASSAPAAEHVVGLVPTNAVGFVVFNRLENTSDKIEKLAGELQLPVPNPLGFFKASAGITEGLNDKGTACLLYMVDGDDVTDGYPIVLMPVTDHEAFSKQFEPEEAEDGIVEVRIADAPVLIGSKGDFAVFAQPEHRDALAKLIAAKPAAQPALVALQPWLDKNDVAGALTPEGVKKLAARGRKELKKVEDEFGDAFDEAGPELASAGQIFSMYSDILKFLGDEVTSGGVGMRISDDGDVFISKRALFNPGGAAAGAIAKAKPMGEQVLASLPGGPYVIAGGGHMAGLMSDALVDWSMSMIKANPQIYGFDELTDEEARKLAEVSQGSLSDVQWMSMMMGPGEGDDAIYGSVTGVFGVTDSAKYITAYKKSMETWNEIAAKAKSGKAMKWEMEDLEVEGAKGILVSLDMTKLAGEEGPPELQAMFEKMFGADGKMNIYLVPAGKTSVLMSYSKKQLKADLAHMKSGKAGLTADAGVAKTGSKLPKQASAVGYVSPQGFVTMVNRMMAMFAPVGLQLPDFPAAPPFGFAVVANADGVEAEAVLPGDTLKACYDYAQQVQLMFGGPQ